MCYHRSSEHVVEWMREDEPEVGEDEVEADEEEADELEQPPLVPPADD